MSCVMTLKSACVNLAMSLSMASESLSGFNW